jgi:hypothetical protein
MYSPEIHKLLSKVLGKENVKENDIYSLFTDAFSKWINSSKLNSLKGLSAFEIRNIIRGVTHSLDDLHAVHGQKIVILPNEYKYHERIGDQRILPFKQWKSGDVAVVSFPFSHTGNSPEQWEEILEHCEREKIELHIDAAWYGVCRDLELDLFSSAIKSISFSLSKPLGLGNYPIGVRFQKGEMRGPVETVNEFKMISPLMIHIGLSFIEEFPIDFFQNKYHEAYKIVVKEFGLIESNSIHVALEEKGAELVPVGIRGFLRQIVEGEFR